MLQYQVVAISQVNHPSSSSCVAALWIACYCKAVLWYPSFQSPPPPPLLFWYLHLSMLHCHCKESTTDLPYSTLRSLSLPQFICFSNKRIRLESFTGSVWRQFDMAWVDRYLVKHLIQIRKWLLYMLQNLTRSFKTGYFPWGNSVWLWIRIKQMLLFWPIAWGYSMSGVIN